MSKLVNIEWLPSRYDRSAKKQKKQQGRFGGASCGVNSMRKIDAEELAAADIYGATLQAMRERKK
jgi:hypothetical protein